MDLKRRKISRKTKRLIIRPLEAKDFSAWKSALMFASEPKNNWDRKPRPKNEITQKKFREILAYQKKMRDKDNYYDLTVFSRANGEILGGVSAMEVARGVSHSAFLGYSILNRFWGQGFGKEAVNAMLDIAFKVLNLHRLEAGIEPGNRRSIFLARSLRLRKEGLKKRAIFLRDKWVDLIMYSITCEEKGIQWKGKLSLRKR